MTKQATYVRREDSGWNRLKYHDGDHRPSWLRYGSGTLNVTATIHENHQRLGLVVLEVSDEKASSKQTFATLSREATLALYQTLKQIIEPASSDDAQAAYAVAEARARKYPTSLI